MPPSRPPLSPIDPFNLQMSAPHTTDPFHNYQDHHHENKSAISLAGLRVSTRFRTRTPSPEKPVKDKDKPERPNTSLGTWGWFHDKSPVASPSPSPRKERSKERLSCHFEESHGPKDEVRRRVTKSPIRPRPNSDIYLCSSLDKDKEKEKDRDPVGGNKLWELLRGKPLQKEKEKERERKKKQLPELQTKISPLKDVQPNPSSVPLPVSRPSSPVKGGSPKKAEGVVRESGSGNQGKGSNVANLINVFNQKEKVVKGGTVTASPTSITATPPTSAEPREKERGRTKATASKTDLPSGSTSATSLNVTTTSKCPVHAPTPTPAPTTTSIPSDLNTAFEELLESRNIPTPMRHKMRQLDPHIKTDFIQNHYQQDEHALHLARGGAHTPLEPSSPVKSGSPKKSPAKKRSRGKSLVSSLGRAAGLDLGWISGNDDEGAGAETEVTEDGGKGTSRSRRRSRARSLAPFGRDKDKEKEKEKDKDKDASPKKRERARSLGPKKRGGSSRTRSFDFGRPASVLSFGSARSGKSGKSQGSQGSRQNSWRDHQHNGTGLGSALGDTSSALWNLSRPSTAPTASVSAADLLDETVDPADFVHYLREVQRPDLVQVPKLHKLRLLLRNEAMTWVDAFLSAGGLCEIVELIYRVLALEWREEHEDSLLCEALLCLKALATTRRGLQGLDECAGRLFPTLLGMLFDEQRKGPAEFSTRGIVTSLLFAYLSAAKVEADGTGMNARVKRAEQVLGYLRDPDQPKEAQPPTFIKNMHTVRPYKVWCREVSNVSREVFWIFLHGMNVVPIQRRRRKQRRPTSAQDNTYDDNHDHDDDDNEDTASDEDDDQPYATRFYPTPRNPVPVAPYVGGVEWDATNYIASHLDLMNACIASQPTLDRRNALRAELRVSGFERVMGERLRTCKEKFYGGVHEGLRLWVAAAREDGWEVEGVRRGVFEEDKGGGHVGSCRVVGKKKKGEEERPPVLEVEVGAPKLSLDWGIGRESEKEVEVGLERGQGEGEGDGPSFGDVTGQSQLF